MPNRKTHVGVGAGSGGIAALAKSQGQGPEDRILEIIGGALAGAGGARLPDVFDPPTWPGHRSLGHGVVPSGIGLTVVLAKMDEWQRALRERAEEQVELRDSADTTLANIWHGILELVFRLLAGAVVGFPTGYASHLLLDATTPKCLPLIA
ncbi:MAG: hypothetical protein HN341_01645 [Verrucomicrobia bacterium]|jgi:hypothetical protein|nr:hypothetical protein [Verrucomicrobiota bacterium]